MMTSEEARDLMRGLREAAGAATLPIDHWLVEVVVRIDRLPVEDAEKCGLAEHFFHHVRRELPATWVPPTLRVAFEVTHAEALIPRWLR